MNAHELARPDNEADRTINLAISGNRLVSILNALDQLAYEAGRYRFEGNNLVADSAWWTELREVTEATRDELSRQRCKTQPKETTFVPLPHVLRRTIDGGCQCKYCKANPSKPAAWDTVAYDGIDSWVVHFPELG